MVKKMKVRNGKFLPIAGEEFSLGDVKTHTRTKKKIKIITSYTTTHPLEPVVGIFQE